MYRLSEVTDNNILKDIPFKTRHSNWKYASNGSFQLVGSILSATQSMYLYFYYFNVLGLNNVLILIALIIFSIYDAVNDPLIGYLVDRNFKWTKKFGRRFPWIVIGIGPWCLSLYLIFSAPAVDASVNPLPVFFWLLISLFIFDTFGSMIGINVMALRPDLFREESERQKLTYYWTFFDMIAVAVGMLVPPLFLGAGNNRASFALMGGMISVIALVCAIMFLPGAHEDKIVIDRYYSGDYKRMNFFGGIKQVLKQKSFIVFFIALNVFAMTTSILMTMGPYVNNFLLRGAPGDEVIIYAIFILGTIISVPFWLKYLKKIENNKKVISVGGLFLGISLIPLTFFVTAIDLYIFFFIVGIAMGSMWSCFYTIIQASVVDDFVATTKKNQKGVLLGVSVLLGRLVATVDEGIITLVQIITGFPAGVADFASLEAAIISTGGNLGLALLGIRLLVGIIPAIILILGTLIWWKYFPLTQEKILQNKKILEEIGF